MLLGVQVFSYTHLARLYLCAFGLRDGDQVVIWLVLLFDLLYLFNII